MKSSKRQYTVTSLNQKNNGDYLKHPIKEILESNWLKELNDLSSQEREELEEASATFIIDRIEDLIEIVNKGI